MVKHINQSHLIEDDDIRTRANINFAQWPDLIDRIELQQNEDALIKEMVEWGTYSDEQIVRAVERERNLLWYPGRAR
jgi:hypothetical protein